MPPLPEPRGPISELIVGRLSAPSGGSAVEVPVTDADVLSDDDLQLALYCLYELHYQGFDGVDETWEWEPALLAFRRELEERFERAICEAVGAPAAADPATVPELLFEIAADDEGPSLSRFMKRGASAEQFQEFLVHRSAYQLKEADPHSWAIPRLRGPAKAALVEVQADEYGGGRPERVHATLFAKSMRALELDPAYGTYLDMLPGPTLATVNLMSMLGLQRRWRGAIVGHLACFEITSPVPNRRYATGLRRLGCGADALDFFEEHVEADSVHENIAAYDLAGALATAEPKLAGDILFGARALVHLDARWAAGVLEAWAADRTSLRGRLPASGASDLEALVSRNGDGKLVPAS
jgi:hypothetical protein